MTTTTDLGLLSAHATPCPTCPWRVGCQDSTEILTNPLATPPEYYIEEGRQRLWADWNRTGLGARDGYRISCHRGPAPVGAINPELRWCAGGAAVQDRALLRWIEGGCTVEALGPLSGVAAAKMIAADLLGVEPADIGDDWTVAGVPVTYDRLLAAVHPGVTDCDVAYAELVPPPTAAESERWRRPTER